MKIFGHPWSLNTRKVLLMFAEKGHPAELSVVALPQGEHKAPEHLARHPFGKVPALQNGEFVLYESRAINAYVDRVVQGPSLTPADAEGAALVDQWVAVADNYLAPHADPLVVETIFRRYLGGDADRAAIERARAGLDAPLAAADARLRGRAFLAGDQFSRADVHWVPYIDYLQRAGEGERIQRYERLAAWWRSVSERPTWRAVAHTGPQP